MFHNFARPRVLRAPLFRRPIGKGRQMKTVRANKRVGIAQDGIDFRTFHSVSIQTAGCVSPEPRATIPVSSDEDYVRFWMWGEYGDWAIQVTQLPAMRRKKIEEEPAIPNRTTSSLSMRACEICAGHKRTTETPKFTDSTETFLRPRVTLEMRTDRFGIIFP